MIRKISNTLYLVERKNLLTNKEQKIYLLGTAHVSKKSKEEVKKVIEEVKPQVVALELCKKRYKKLLFKDQWLNTNIFDVIQNKEHFMFLLNIILSSYQKTIGEKVGVMPGSEFLEADSIAKQNNINVALIDRDINITLKRAFDNTSLWEKLKLLFGIIAGFFVSKPKEELIEELKKEDVLNQALDEFTRQMPSLKKVLVDERNIFMAQNILRLPNDTILAIVGAGHLREIAKLVNNTKKLIDLKPLNKISSKKKKKNYFNWVSLVLFVVLLGYGFIAKGLTIGLNMLLFWILATGGLAALGALIGGASFFSVLVAFIVAPFTTIHPLLAAGWFVGIMELKKNKPTIKDFLNLKSIKGLKDFRHNNILRILVIVSLTNLGATIGTLFAFPLLISYVL